MSQFTKTFVTSPPTSSPQMELALTLSAGGSRARISASRGSRLGLTEIEAASGRRSCDLLATYDPNTSSWRTSQICLVAQASNQADGSAAFSQTWPRSGLMRNGSAFRRPPLVDISLATEFGSLPRVPRPVACDGKGAGRLRWGRINGGGMNLRDWCAWQLSMAYPPVHLGEYLMGFPIDWTALPQSATPSSRRSRKSSAAPS